MSRHHPKNTTLADYTAGTLNEGRSLVVATHLAMCAHCRGFVSALEDAGGRLLVQSEPAAMSEGAADRALNVIAREAREPATPQAKPIVWSDEQVLGYGLGPWRWVSPGLHYRAVHVPAGDTRLFMLKAKPSLRIPAHSHTGTELTTILQGAFIHEGGRYGAGDCDDADHEVGHSPVIDGGEECICLVAMQGQIKLTGMLGRMIQPFIRI